MAKHDNLRINFYFFFILAAAAVISYNLFVITYVQHHSYSRTARAHRENISNVLARGNIYLGEHLAATNKKFPLAYIVPAEIDGQRAEEAAGQISSVLGIDKNEVKDVINSGSDKFRVLSRRIEDEQAAAIKTLGIKGLGVTYETDRYYPGGSFSASVIGFLGYSGDKKSGQYGIEAFYDDELFGKKRSIGNYVTGSGIIDFISKALKGSEAEETDDNKIDRPSDVVLSIDKNIQQIAEDKLDALMKKLEAAGGTIIIQDPNTGKILAMGDRPTFDPNNYSEYEPRNFLNRGIQEIFEPGSSFKPITMAMGLDLGVITPQTTFNDVGFREEAGYKIKNFSERVFGNVTMLEVLERSINTGAMHVQGLVGNKNFLDYVINFGFGQGTGIDLPGEIHGDITNLYSGRQINFLTASFGQGIAVTSLQLINAYSAIANGGKLMRPYVVEKIIEEGGVETVTEPEIVTIPISEKTATRVKTMLVSVVDNGFDKARISGYDIAGKTGTAQIPDGKGGYLENEYIHDFVGFAPAFDPKFVILIKIDRPKGITFAADSLSPTFKEITQYLLNYYNIPPTRR
ncbi:MAG: penicillin-binding protein 2 [Candidatus Yanofskybacteria bacterium]|nr:penicillin-binding protein 2 [Candidatus Yanofskybacteria bacterium]